MCSICGKYNRKHRRKVRRKAKVDLAKELRQSRDQQITKG